jgi:molybdenum cofactor cytidylyltransferase
MLEACYIMTPAPTIIVLAAGAGSRFDAEASKLRRPVGDASMLSATLCRAIEARLPVLAVTVASLLPCVSPWLARRDIVVLDDAMAARGVGRAISAGVSERPHAGGWVVVPGDLCGIQPATLRTLAAGLHEHPVVVAQHRGRRGPVAAFSGELYSELVALDGDEGARRLVSRYPAHGEEVDDPAILPEPDSGA